MSIEIVSTEKQQIESCENFQSFFQAGRGKMFFFGRTS